MGTDQRWLMATARMDLLHVTTTRPTLLVLVLVLLFLSLDINPWITVFANSPPPKANGAFPFLEDVVEAVAEKEGWDLAAVRVSRLLEDGRAKVGRLQRYEFHMHAAGRNWVFRAFGGVSPWKAMEGAGGEGVLGPELLAGRVCRKRVLKAFELEGPLELRAAGGGELSVLLPGNASHDGIKKVIIGEGMKIKIRRALEVSIVVPNDLRFLVNRSLVANTEYRHWLLPQKNPLCRQMLTVYVQGLASTSAYMIRDPRASIKTTFHTPDILELLPEKCFRNGYFRRRSPVDILSLGSRLDLIEKTLRSFLGNKITKTGIPYFLKLKFSSVTLVKFWIEIEREIDYEDSEHSKSAQWKTKPRFGMDRFEIIARLEDNKKLKSVAIKKLKKPVIVAEITAWSSFMFNLSLSKFLSSVMPPDPLTLDVKW